MRYIVLCLLGLSVMMGQVFQSTQTRTNVIELFTSEGCSSCPPAEAWMNELKDKEGLFKTFIPVVFHVSYWNRLGWEDTFSNISHDNRQRWYSSKWGSSTIYTPGFVINGKEYREWFNTRAFPRFEHEDAGSLHVRLDGTKVHLMWDAKSTREPLHVNIAVLGFGYSVHVMNGENAGKTLEHDFTVLGWKQFAYTSNTTELTLPSFKNDASKKALTVWLSDEKGEIIQAVGGYFK